MGEGFREAGGQYHTLSGGRPREGEGASLKCNNIISLKVTNERDKGAVAAMMTDSLVGLVDMLPNLDVGECIVVGDAIKLPTKILLDEPKETPKSSTIDFWDRWNDRENTIYDLDSAILNLVRQSRR